MTRRAICLCVALWATAVPVAGHESATQPIRFLAEAGAVSPGALAIPFQYHDHPYSIVAPHGPISVPGVVEVGSAVARAEAGRPGAARKQVSSVSLSDVVLFPRTFYEISLGSFRASASASCTETGVELSGSAARGSFASPSSGEVVPQPAPNEVVYSDANLKVTLNYQSPSQTAIFVAAAQVVIRPVRTTIYLGAVRAGVPLCPKGDTWARAPEVAIGLRTLEPSRGEGRFTESASCIAGGTGSHYHFDYTAPISDATPDAASRSLAGTADVFLDVHQVGRESAFLLRDASRFALRNGRGTLSLALQAGDCGDPDLKLVLDRAIGSGTWTVAGGTGAYRDARGSGTFQLDAGIRAGARNTLSLTLYGNVSVLMPRLTFRISEARWGSVGYAEGRVGITLDVSSDGPGDVFGAEIVRVRMNGPVYERPVLPVYLGNLPSGRTAQTTFFVAVGPAGCARADCPFPAGFDVDVRTALDQIFRVFTDETVVPAGVPS